jgi:hypothetical protein
MGWYRLYRKVRRHPFIIFGIAIGVICVFPFRVTEILQHLRELGCPRSVMDCGKLCIIIIGLIVLVFGLVDWSKRSLRKRVILPTAQALLGITIFPAICYLTYEAWPYWHRWPTGYLLVGAYLMMSLVASRILISQSIKPPEKPLPLFDWTDRVEKAKASAIAYAEGQRERERAIAYFCADPAYRGRSADFFYKHYKV